MRIAITGAGGQLGAAIAAYFSAYHTIIPLQQPAFDLADVGCIQQIVATNATMVLHTAAYTNVDGCARDPQLAYRVNALGTRYVALACQQLGVPMVYISTNEIFDGSASQPYQEYDPPHPINAYGYSKLAGERAVTDLLQRFFIVRVAWLYGGERNFVRTVLRLAKEDPHRTLQMTFDEIGSPTLVSDIAPALYNLIGAQIYGTYHIVNDGACSRYELAQAILQQTGYDSVSVKPIRLRDYKRASTPPPYSPLKNIAAAALGISLRPWHDALSDHLAARHSPTTGDRESQTE